MFLLLADIRVSFDPMSHQKEVAEKDMHCHCAVHIVHVLKIRHQLDSDRVSDLL